MFISGVQETLSLNKKSSAQKRKQATNRKTSYNVR